jgi:hypothetical protein
VTRDASMQMVVGTFYLAPALMTGKSRQGRWTCGLWGQMVCRAGCMLPVSRSIIKMPKLTACSLQKPLTGVRASEASSSLFRWICLEVYPLSQLICIVTRGPFTWRRNAAALVVVHRKQLRQGLMNYESDGSLRTAPPSIATRFAAAFLFARPSCGAY